MDWEILRYIAIALLVLGVLGTAFSMGRFSGEQRLRRRLDEEEADASRRAEQEAQWARESDEKSEREREAREERHRKLREKDPT